MIDSKIGYPGVVLTDKERKILMDYLKGIKESMDYDLPELMDVMKPWPKFKLDYNNKNKWRVYNG